MAIRLSRRRRAYCAAAGASLVIVFLGFGASTLALMHQVASHLGTVARHRQRRWPFSIWNVAWVARTLVVVPVHVFDANIFYPHAGRLPTPKPNLGEGALRCQSTG